MAAISPAPRCETALARRFIRHHRDQVHQFVVVLRTFDHDIDTLKARIQRGCNKARTDKIEIALATRKANRADWRPSPLKPQLRKYIVCAKSGQQALMQLTTANGQTAGGAQ